MTPAYAAPEQIRGEAVSTATDVYQFGVLTYELLTGHRPFEGAAGRAVEEAILETAPRSPSTVVSERRADADAESCTGPVTPTAISAARDTTPRQLCHRLEGDLNTIVTTALRKEPERRYASIEAVLGDLDRYREGQPIEARSASLEYRTQKFLLRHRWGVGITVAFLGLIATFGFLLVQQRERAEQEAQKAEIVSSYLVDLFSSGTPYGPADTVTARTLVRRGLSRVKRLDDRPVVQAEMLDALGQASRGIGEWNQADSLLQRSLTLRRRHLQSPHPDLVASLLHVADTRWSNQRLWEARPLYEEALFMSRQLRLEDRRHRADILEGLAKTMSQQGAPDSAEVLMRKAIDLRRRQRGSHYHGLPLDQMDLARIVQRQGKHGEAEELYRAGLRKMESGAGYTSPERVAAYKNFGDLLLKKGENVAAATYYRKAIRLTVDEMREGHPRARRARDKLYKTLIERGLYDEALAVARTNLDVLRQRHDSSHSSVPMAYQRVGHLLDNMGRSATAEPLLERAVRLQEQARGAQHIWTHSTRVRYALCLVERGQYSTADRLLQNGEIALGSTPADSTTVDLDRMKAILLVGKGRLSAEREEWKWAETYLERGYRIRRQQMGIRAPLNQRALRALAEVHEVIGQSDRAAAYRDSLIVR
jgi:serine/threonine-protein kinase